MIRRSVLHTSMIAVCIISGLAYGDDLGSGDPDNDLRKPSSWTAPSIEVIIDGYQKWLLNHQKTVASQPPILADTIDQMKQSLMQATASQRIDVIVNGISVNRPDVADFIRQLQQRETTGETIHADHFQYDVDDAVESDFVQNHVRLFYGRWLAQNQLYDEALAQLKQIDLQSVLDPATLLFYRGLMQHQLLLKEPCLQTAKKLLENEDVIPRRYAAIGKLMISDLEPLETDSLDEIARLMSDVRRRTSLNRAGTRVITDEKKVIDKLDKLIEDLEEKQQQSKSQSGSRQAPTQPIRASQVAGGGATGETENKRQSEGGNWGDLPPAERAAAMAEMTKDMPPHYRAVIEEYFRRLAEK